MRKLLLLGLVLTLSTWGISVPTAQYDNFRDGANNQETLLSPGTLPNFKRLGSYIVDGPVWGQPLIAQNIGGKDLLVVCTLLDSCFAFDAREPNTAPIWMNVQFATSRATYPDMNGGAIYNQPLGCLSTPVIDLFNRTLYVVCTNSIPSWIIYKLDLTTGNILQQTTISGSYPGTGDIGDTVVNGQVVFNPNEALSRPALTLANGNIYVAFGSYGDLHPWHGWIFSYDAKTLTKKAILNTTPNSYGGSIWLSGGGMAVDTQGNLYTPTGNGHAGYANSVIKLSPDLQVLGAYIPANQSDLEAEDWDLTSGRPALVPGTSLLVFGAKDSNFYSIDTTCMCNAQLTQVTTVGSGLINYGVYGGSVIGNGIVYFPGTPGGVFSYILNSTTWNPFGASPSYGYPGAALIFSSNSGNNAILWVITAPTATVTTAQPGTLRAWNPITFNEFWNSDMHTGDTLGSMSKFASPTVANGNVYVSTLDGKIQVYGLPMGNGDSQILGNSSLTGSTVLQ